MFIVTDSKYVKNQNKTKSTHRSYYKNVEDIKKVRYNSTIETKERL